MRCQLLYCKIFWMNIEGKHLFIPECMDIRKSFLEEVIEGHEVTNAFSSFHHFSLSPCICTTIPSLACAFNHCQCSPQWLLDISGTQNSTSMLAYPILMHHPISTVAQLFQLFHTPIASLLHWFVHRASLLVES